MKKIYLILICLLLLTACKQTSAPEAPASEEVVTTEETEPIDNRVDAEQAETIAQRIERQDIQDVQALVDMELASTSETLNLNIKSTSELAYSAQNNGLHVVIDSIVNDKPGSASQLNVYADKEFIYVSTNFDPTWHKFTHANQTIDPENLINMYTTTKFREFYDQWKDQLVVEESDTAYTITLEGSGPEFTDYVRQTMNTLQGLQVDNALFEIYNVKALKVQHTFDKASNLPTSLEIGMNYMFRGESVNVEHVLDLNVTYQAVNQGMIVTLPAELEGLEVEGP